MKLTKSNLNRVVTRAQERAEREHNKGEQRVCGGCRWFKQWDHHGMPLTTGDCTALLPIWLGDSWRLRGPYRNVLDKTTDATDCEAYEHV